MTQQVFASFIGVSPGTLSSIFTGRTNPTLNIVESIKSKIPTISTDWLMFGHGQMYLDSTTSDNTPSTGSDNDNQQPSLDFGFSANDSSAPLFDSVAQQQRQGVKPTPNNYSPSTVKIIDKPERRITEIRIFYDDQTWETFVPKK